MAEKVPARLNVVTFGVRDLPAVRSFYEALGWESRSADDEFARFEIGGAVLLRSTRSTHWLRKPACRHRRKQKGSPASPAPSLCRAKRWLTQLSRWCVKQAVEYLPSQSHGNGADARATSPIRRAMSGR